MSYGPKRGIWDVNPPPHTLLTTKQAARRLGVSESFLERDRWKGATIPFIRIGERSVRYHPDDLAAYLYKKTGEANGSAPNPGDRSW